MTDDKIKEFEKPVEKNDGDPYNMQHVLLTEDEMELIPNTEEK